MTDSWAAYSVITTFMAGAYSFIWLVCYTDRVAAPHNRLLARMMKVTEVIQIDDLRSTCRINGRPVLIANRCAFWADGCELGTIAMLALRRRRRIDADLKAKKSRAAQWLLLEDTIPLDPDRLS